MRGTEVRRVTVPGNFGQNKLVRPHLYGEGDMVALTHHPSDGGKHKIGGSQYIPGHPGYKVRSPSPK
jgi:hypothetical protein